MWMIVFAVWCCGRPAGGSAGRGRGCTLAQVEGELGCLSRLLLLPLWCFRPRDCVVEEGCVSGVEVGPVSSRLTARVAVGTCVVAEVDGADEVAAEVDGASVEVEGTGVLRITRVSTSRDT